MPSRRGHAALGGSRAQLGRGALAFFLLTFGATWAAWLAAARLDGISALGVLRVTLFFLGVFAPALIALALTARSAGRAGVDALLRRIVTWDVGWRWYLFAAGFMAAVKLAAALFHRLATGGWPRFGEAPVAVMVLALAVSTWTQAGEEIGWRGYALPRLAARFGLPLASVLLGALWAAWHLPLFLSPQGDLHGQSMVVYLLQVVALSVAMAWLFWRTAGSLLPVMLLHAAVNNTKDIVPSAVGPDSPAVWLGGTLVAWITVALLWLAAIGFLQRMRGAGAEELG